MKEENKVKDPWQIMIDAGLTLSQRMYIRAEYIKENVSNVKKDGNYFKNDNIEGYLFNTKEEAEFIEHFFNYVKKGNTLSRTIDLFKILNTLIGNESEWKY